MLYRRFTKLGVFLDEEDDINESTGQGSDAGYYSTDEDDDEKDTETNEDDKNEDNDDDDDGNNEDMDNEEDTSVEKGIYIRARGDQANEEEQEEVEETVEDEEESGRSNKPEQDEGFDESSKVVDYYEEVEIEQDISSLDTSTLLEGDDTSTEQHMEVREDNAMQLNAEWSSFSSLQWFDVISLLVFVTFLIPKTCFLLPY